MGSEICVSKEGIAPIDYLLEVGEADKNRMRNVRA